MIMPPPDVSVVILTYDRNELLARTLDSIAAQRNALGLRYEIVVVDNHKDGIARAVVTPRGGSGPPIRYLHDIRRNISLLRNAGAAAATADVIAFIDDDETASPGWIDSLVGALHRTGADIAVGPRLPHCDGDEMDQFARKKFTFDFGFPPDAEIRFLNRLGRPLYGLSTGNCAFHAKLRDEVAGTEGGGPFDLEYGIVGGEDTEFFSRMTLRGRRIVWAADAVVSEFIPPHRTEMNYVLSRVRRETQTFAQIYLRNTTARMLVRAELLVHGTLQFLVGGGMARITGENSSVRKSRWRTMHEIGHGKLSWQKPAAYIGEQSVR
jgi:succinoglycan biosynthesis protein ExoM